MADAALAEENIYFTNLPVGEILRRTRLHYGRSLEEIEKTLRIRATQLEALEDGRFEELPAKVYAIGFVRSYAEYLGLDGEKMVHLFKTQAQDKEPPKAVNVPVPANESKLPSKALLLASLLTILVISGIYGATREKERAVVDAIPEVPKTLQASALEKSYEPTRDETAEQNEQAQEQSTETTAVLDKKPEKGIVLNIIENSWVEIRPKNSRRKLISQVLKAGDQYFVPDRPDLLMSIGNASGVEIEVDGEPLRLLGGRGVVRRNIPLDGGYLKAQYAKPEE